MSTTHNQCLKFSDNFTRGLVAASCVLRTCPRCIGILFNISNEDYYFTNQDYVIQQLVSLMIQGCEVTHQDNNTLSEKDETLDVSTTLNDSTESSRDTRYDSQLAQASLDTIYQWARIFSSHEADLSYLPNNDDFNRNTAICSMCCGLLQTGKIHYDDAVVAANDRSNRKRRRAAAPWFSKEKRKDAKQEMDAGLVLNNDTPQSAGTTSDSINTRHTNSHMDSESNQQNIDKNLEKSSHISKGNNISPAQAVSRIIQHRNYDCTHGTLNIAVPTSTPVYEHSVRAVLMNIQKPVKSTHFEKCISEEYAIFGHSFKRNLVHMLDIKELVRRLFAAELAYVLPQLRQVTQQWAEETMVRPELAKVDDISPGDLGLTISITFANVEADQALAKSLNTPIDHNFPVDANNRKRRVLPPAGQISGTLNKYDIHERPKNATGEFLLPLCVDEPNLPLPATKSSECAFSSEIARSPVYIAGRYQKLQRGLSQSPWVIDGERYGDVSVEELIGEPLKAETLERESDINRSISSEPIRAGHAISYKFHSAGREDMDVRMLGKGRPFVIELLESRASERLRSNSTIEAIEHEINHRADGKIVITDLKRVDRRVFAALQSGAGEKRKTYSCVVWTSARVTPQFLMSRLDSVKELSVAQQTPIRVLHRRSLLTRDKTIHAMRTEWINPHYFLLFVETSAGTYVKEFVHGDRGRTWPNVGALLSGPRDLWRKGQVAIIERLTRPLMSVPVSVAKHTSMADTTHGTDTSMLEKVSATTATADTSMSEKVSATTATDTSMSEEVPTTTEKTADTSMSEKVSATTEKTEDTSMSEKIPTTSTTTDTSMSEPALTTTEKASNVDNNEVYCANIPSGLPASQMHHSGLMQEISEDATPLPASGVTPGTNKDVRETMLQEMINLDTNDFGFVEADLMQLDVLDLVETVDISEE